MRRLNWSDALLPLAASVVVAYMAYGFGKSDPPPAPKPSRIDLLERNDEVLLKVFTDSHNKLVRRIDALERQQRGELPLPKEDNDEQ